MNVPSLSRRVMFRITRRAIAVTCAFALLITTAPLATHTAHATDVAPPEAQTALMQGRALLMSGQDDQAFAQLDAALKLFTAANDASGRAAAEDAIGDIYTRAGQYAEALKHYTAARDAFKLTGDTDNTNAALAKIGETNFLLGDTNAARAAFAAMNVTAPADAAKNAEQSKEKNKPAGAGAASASSGAICSLLSLAGVNTGGDPSNLPNMGRAPRTPNGIGRMDLRVVDEAGNPLKSVQAQIKSKRPGGLFCECFESTSALGRAIMPPLHIADKITLVLKSAGDKFELPLNAEALDQPVQVVVSKTGARLASVAAQAAIAAAGFGACFGFYRSLVFFSNSKLGKGRAAVLSNDLQAAKLEYEDLLKQLNLNDIAHLNEIARFRTAARTALGDIAFKENRYDDAIKLYTAARDGAKTDNRLDLMWAAQRGIGRSLYQQSLASTDPNAAARLRSESIIAYRDALKTIEAIRVGSLRSDDARTTFLATTKDVYDEAAEILIEAALVAAGNTTGVKPLEGYALTLAAEAFKITEQGRARSLLDMLTESRTVISEGVAPATLKRKIEIIARQNEIMETLTGVALAADKAKADVPALEAELGKLANEQAALENQIRVANPRYASLTATQPLTLSDVQARVLDDKTALVEYSLGARSSILFLVTRNAVIVQRLPARAEVEAQAIQLRTQLIPEGLRRSIVGIDVAKPASESEAAPSNNVADPATYAQAAHRLYKTILEPVASIVADKRLLVVADGALNYVPFEALVTAPAASDADFSSLAYLIKTNEVMYAPSASVLDAIRAQTARSPANNVARNLLLVVADPVFNLTDSRVKSAAAAATTASDAATRTRGLLLTSALSDVTKNSTGLNLVRLSGTRTEANDIAMLARSAGGNADVWLDFDANAANVRERNVQNYRVLHFATHGILNAERPQFTGLVLSLVGNSGGDGFLRTNEVFNLRLGSPLVMLSACETGLGKNARGEGVIGLTRAFMYAGAPTVGVSLWSVSDRSTARLMGDFYKQLLSVPNTSPSVALRQAQTAMIANPRYSAPFFWAPFVLVGEWR